MLVVLVLVMGATFAVVAAPTALAAPVTHTSDISLSGISPEQLLFSGFAVCDTCAPDDLFSCGGCEVAAYGEVSVNTSVSWTAPVSIESEYDPDELHQGDTATVENSLTPGAGPLKIRYRFNYQVGLFACGGDFDPCVGDSQETKEWQPTQYTISDEKTIQAGGDCALPITGTTNCPVVDTVNLIPETCFFDLCPVDITVDLIINHTFTIDAGDVDVHRTATFESPTDFSFSGSTPSIVSDAIDIPCDAEVGETVNYRLGPASYAVDNISVAGDADLDIDIDGPGPLNANPVIDLVSGTVYDDGLAMTGDAAPEFALGDVQLDNKAPVVNAIMQAGSFVEGSELTFSALATDNCAAGLSYAWRYSDDGRGFFNPTNHTFGDNGHYTGTVIVSDAAGNQTTKDFAVNGATGVTNGDPSVTPPPNAAAVWGVPISFHADAVDPGSADQSTLAFSWNFGDGAGALGSDVSHAYALPGTYPVVVTVTDKDGGVGSAPLTVEISKRGTSLVYTGAIQGLPNKYSTLSAQLTDELGEPVSGRTVDFAVGTLTTSGLTNGSGIASKSLKVTLKPGDYALSSSFAGDSRYIASSDSDTFVVGK
jgi:PKD repeat protein